MKKSIGIDLGTTNSVISYKDTRVKIIPNRENEELTRSCICLRKGEILVGKNAYNILLTDPVNTVLSVKRLMGGAIKDPLVQKMKDSPYYKFSITSLKGGTEDAVAIILGGKQYTPEQLSAEILKKLKCDAEEKLGGEVTHAVITVPAYFTEKQKNATRIAAQLAGLKVQKLLSEPTAAAIAYGVDNLKVGEAKTVLVYDFGGGTFDLSIINIVDGQYMETGTGGDRWLGGDDLDRTLQEYVLKRISKEYNIEDINSLIANLDSKRKFQFEGQFRDNIENIKIQLSSSFNAPLIMPGIEDENGEWIDFDLTVTREEFERLAKPFVERSIELIDALFNEVGYDISMIDNILLVGGTSCIPLIKKMLSNKFGAERILLSENPMLAIAKGAGILSHRMGDEYEPSIEGENAIDEISYSTNHNYFLELKNETALIIEKQHPLPCNVTRSYKTAINNQRIVKVAIYSDVENGKKEVQTIGFFTLEDYLPVGSDIVLDFTLGIDEIFEVKAYLKTKKDKEKKIVLARGDKDQKTLGLLSDSFEKIFGNNYSLAQREFFLKSAKREIENINALGAYNHDSDKWEAIGASIFTSFEQAEGITESVDEDKLIVLFANILIKEYPDLISEEDKKNMVELLSKVQNEDDPLYKVQVIQKLKDVTDNYPVLITLFTVKLISDKVAEENPSDGIRLMQMHDQIVSHFRNRRKEEAFALLNDAIILRDKYHGGAIDLAGSILLKK